MLAPWVEEEFAIAVLFIRGEDGFVVGQGEGWAKEMIEGVRVFVRKRDRVTHGRVLCGAKGQFFLERCPEVDPDWVCGAALEDDDPSGLDGFNGHLQHFGFGDRFDAEIELIWRGLLNDLDLLKAMVMEDGLCQLCDAVVAENGSTH